MQSAPQQDSLPRRFDRVCAKSASTYAIRRIGPHQVLVDSQGKQLRLLAQKPSEHLFFALFGILPRAIALYRMRSPQIMHSRDYKGLLRRVSDPIHVVLTKN